MSATRKQTIIWTPLPNGFTPDGTKLKLSVFLSPRLVSDEAAPRLSGFPDWQSWPEAASAIGFVVKLGDKQISGTFKPLTPPEAGVGLKAGALWALLFPPLTKVE